MSELAKRLRENADGFFKDLPGMEQFRADLLAAAEIVERAEWKPIAGAPKDEYVEVWADGRFVPFAVQQPIALDSPHYRWWAGGGCLLDKPSHWRPLTAPPEVKP